MAEQCKGRAEHRQLPSSAVPALELIAVGFERDGLRILDDVSWRVEPDQRWVVLGPNGSGKTTMLRLASGYDHPTTGTVDILGERLGRVDVRELRKRLGITSADLAKRLRPSVAAIDVVLTGVHAALETWWNDYGSAERSRALALLEAAGLAHLQHHPFVTLSEGERQQVQLARALMGRPELLLLDEPNAGLDLGARERLLGRLTDLAVDPMSPPMVLVTHHLEEIPAGFTHLLLLRSGQVVATGPLEGALSDASLSDCFGISLRVIRHGHRYSCHAV
ncbi:MAG TPA: ATP-binding cassette domain-containing protein [Acidimicrobiales bacterium]|nr:ATP-binding cassette domain-containing protein [Acidimicrobiales bacterium]